MKKTDETYDNEEVLTEYRYYFQERAKQEERLILMKVYDSYHILGDDADKVYPILKDPLTHKHAGKMYCYSTKATGYAYHEFSFGKHNLDKVLPILIRANYRLAIIDHNKAFKEWGGHDRVFRQIEEAKRRREQNKPKVWKQMSLFEMEGFLQ